MRIVPLIVAILLFPIAAFAADIREFDIKTIERLGNELTQVSQMRDRGASTPVKKLARKTAIAALKGRLFNIRYDYVVIDDPDGTGFLVYALGTTRIPNDFVLAGHFRVTVSADGGTPERVDALSKSLSIQHGGEGLPVGSHLAGMYMVQIVSSKPLETVIYTSNLAKMPITVATFPDGKIFDVENGKVKDTGEFAGKKQ